ncbi:MAG: hypothetical protein ACE37D_10275 [Pseudomonadales bacterium]|jgi:hypothetical protein
MKIAASIVAVLLIGCIAAYLSLCPCGRLPGAWLTGDSPTAAVTDWSFVNDREVAPLCQVQITTWRPHSINLNCMAVDGELFISCANCEGKNWSQNALSHPNGHIRAGNVVYPVTFSRVIDPAKLDQAWQARLAKIGSDDVPRPGHWWSFQLTSR